MYHALIEDKLVPVEKLHWVKFQDNRVYVNCTEAEGQGIVVDGKIYHIDGREPIDRPTIDLVWQDDVTALKAAQADTDALLIDLTYEMILLDLGV